MVSNTFRSTLAGLTGTRGSGHFLASRTGDRLRLAPGPLVYDGVNLRPRTCALAAWVQTQSLGGGGVGNGAVCNFYAILVEFTVSEGNECLVVFSDMSQP